MINKNAKIFVTGHKGLVGSAVVRRLKYFGYKNILTTDRNKLNLEDQSQVFNFFKKKNINSVINAAAKVGGIYANNKYKADFIYKNLIIQTNVIHDCYQHRVQNLIFLGKDATNLPEVFTRLVVWGQSNWMRMYRLSEIIFGPFH
jgi:GDP-L-fucose synthase